MTQQPGQILRIPSPIERALHKAMGQLSLAYDYGLCPDDDVFFDTMEELDEAIERKKRQQERTQTQ